MHGRAFDVFEPHLVAVAQERLRRHTRAPSPPQVRFDARAFAGAEAQPPHPDIAEGHDVASVGFGPHGRAAREQTPESAAPARASRFERALATRRRTHRGPGWRAGGATLQND